VGIALGKERRTRFEQRLLWMAHLPPTSTECAPFSLLPASAVLAAEALMKRGIA
jgi:hypothetical protein